MVNRYDTNSLVCDTTFLSDIFSCVFHVFFQKKKTNHEKNHHIYINAELYYLKYVSYWLLKYFKIYFQESEDLGSVA